MILKSTGLVEYSTATMLAETYQREIELMRKHFVGLGESCNRLRSAFERNGAYSYVFWLRVEHHSNCRNFDGEGFDAIEKSFHRDAWAALITKLDIRKIMSSKAQAMLDAQLEGKSSFWKDGEEIHLGPLPEITADNIIAVLEGMLSQAGDLVEEKVREEFEFWKPNRDRHATDNTNELAEKVIKGYMVRYCTWNGRYWDANYDRGKHIQSLDHVFHLLDGKGIPEGHDGDFMTAIRSAGKDGKGESTYFKFKCFHNGNIHVRFKRLDLLREFNRIAGGQKLGSKRKERRGTTAV